MLFPALCLLPCSTRAVELVVTHQTHQTPSLKAQVRSNKPSWQEICSHSIFECTDKLCDIILPPSSACNITIQLPWWLHSRQATDSFCVGQDEVMLKRHCFLQLEWAGWGGFVIVCAMTITIIANACYNHMPYVGRDGEPLPS